MSASLALEGPASAHLYLLAEWEQAKMILTWFINWVKCWFDDLVQTAIRDAIIIYRYRPEIKTQLRPKVPLSDQAQLNIGRAYIVTTLAVVISLGFLHWPLAGFMVWFFGLVIPLVFLLIWRKMLDSET